MLFGPRSPEMSQCPSVVLIDILNTFPDIVLLSEQVASFIFMFKLLNVSNYSLEFVCNLLINSKWECHPTLETYYNIPEWLRPTPIQLRIPHPAWMDRIPWYVRRALSMNLFVNE